MKLVHVYEVPSVIALTNTALEIYKPVWNMEALSDWHTSK